MARKACGSLTWRWSAESAALKRRRPFRRAKAHGVYPDCGSGRADAVLFLRHSGDDRRDD